MTKRIIILGTGGNCLDILETLLDINDARQEIVYACAGFLDDDERKWGQVTLGVPVLGPLAAAKDHPDCCFVNGIGSPGNFWRKPDIIATTGLPPDRFEAIIHPTASVARTSHIGPGTVLLQHVTISSNARLGQHVIVLPGTVVSHDVDIGDYSCIAGGACISGAVRVGRCCYLGTNAAIAGELSIGDYCLIGMGSVVRHDVAADTVVAGNPARTLRATRALTQGEPR